MAIGITGGTGFIGQVLMKRLATTRFSCRVFEADLGDYDAVLKFVSGCDQIVHLAGVFSSDFDILMGVNVHGTRNVVEASKAAGIKRLIFSSTGAVYGEPLHDGISSEDDPLLPNTLYGLSKLYAEEYIRFSGIPAVILRFPNVFGDGNKKGVIYNFIHDAKESDSVTLYGDGRQQRNFLYVEDAVDALQLAIEHENIVGVVNIADEALYSLRAILDVLSEQCQLRFTVNYLPAEATNQLRVLSLDIRKAQQVLGWRPKTNLVSGLRKTIESYER